MTDGPNITAEMPAAFAALVSACEQDCMNEHTEGPLNRDDDESPVATGEGGDSALTFGHIRRARAALSAAPVSPAVLAMEPSANPVDVMAEAIAKARRSDDSWNREYATTAYFAIHDAGMRFAPAIDGKAAAPAEGWVLVPVEPTLEMIAAWYRHKNGHHFHDEPPPADTSDYGAYRAMLAARPLTATQCAVGDSNLLTVQLGDKRDEDRSDQERQAHLHNHTNRADAA